MEELYRLVYVSTARPGLTDGDIEEMLNVAQSNNFERFITGYLVHNGQSFMQLLEGPPAEVEDIYGRIVRDPRHSGVVRIHAETVEVRAFPDWPMNYFRVDRHDGIGAMVSRGGDAVESLMEAGMPREILHLFSKFIQQTDYPDEAPDVSDHSGKTRSDQQQDPQA